MELYNQNGYDEVPYPCPSNKKATVKTSGCGVTSMAVIISAMTTTKVAPPYMASYSLNHGCRPDGGTNMAKLAPLITSAYGLTLSRTSNENVLLAHLKAGGLAICNVGGSYGSHKGIFSTGGHYMVVLGTAGDRVKLWDVGYYLGKYSKTKHPERSAVTVNADKTLSCDISVLGSDTANRYPAYYLFKKPAQKTAEKTEEDDDMLSQEQFNVMFDKAMEAYNTKQAAKPVSNWAKGAWSEAEAAGVMDGTKPGMVITREQLAITLKNAGALK